MVKKNILLGLGLAVFLFGLSFVLYLNFTYLGATNKEIEDIVFGQFKMLLALSNLKILLAYLVVGLVIAGFSILLKIEKLHYILLFNMFIWFMFWVRGIKIYPQLFRDQLFTRGFVLKYFQVFVTDFLPLFAIYVIYILIIAAVGIVNKRLPHALLIIAVSFLMILRINVSAVQAPSGSVARPNVLIFGTDSLRPQSISYNGYHRKTPHIDQLFSRGVSFINAKSSLGRTLPTWTSILTSLYPPDHGMRHMFPTKEHLDSASWTTVTDVFNKNGYYTAVVSDFAGDIFPSVRYGFQYIKSPVMDVSTLLKQRCQEIHYFLQGFLINPIGRIFFPEIGGMTLNKDPWYVTRDAKSVIKHSIKARKPFFLVYFSSNNHFPYVTKYPYYSLYSDKNYRGRHKYGLSSDIIETFLEAEVAPDERRHVVNLYDNAVKLFDDNVGEIMEFLEKCNIDKNTIIIIMSDHGENLYEENYGVAHGDHLLGPYATGMVFGISSPLEDFKGLRVKQTVRDIDMAPTILDMVNMEIPGTFRGTSLLPVMRGGEFHGNPAYMETGLWYSPNAPYIANKVRIPYPGIAQALIPEMPWGKVILKKEYEKTVLRAKYKGYQLNEKKYIYMPGENEYKEEFYIDEKRVNKEDITDLEFLRFKEKMVEMFKGKFYIDENGFIREYITD